MRSDDSINNIDDNSDDDNSDSDNDYSSDGDRGDFIYW